MVLDYIQYLIGAADVYMYRRAQVGSINNVKLCVWMRTRAADEPVDLTLGALDDRVIARADPQAPYLRLLIFGSHD